MKTLDPANSRPAIDHSEAQIWWRPVSLGAVLIAGLVTIFILLQARDLGDLAEPSGSNQTLRKTVDVLVSGFTNGVVSIGPLADDPSITRPVSTNTRLELRQAPTVVGAYDRHQNLVGLAVAAGPDTSITISPSSTARALLTLSPLILDSDVDRVIATVQSYSTDPDFDALVAALAENSDLTVPNTNTEAALARLLDRVRFPEPMPDQGCDSLADPRAFTAAGVCVRHTATGVYVDNEQDRWVVLYPAQTQQSAPCEIIAPTGSEGSSKLVTNQTCTNDIHFYAPGPQLDGLDPRQMSASALTFLDNYVAPFLGLTASDSGFSATPPQVDDAAALDYWSREQTTDDRLLILYGTTSTPADRLAASSQLTQTVIADGQSAPPYPLTLGSIEGAEHLLRLYDRVTPLMTSTRTASRWNVTGRAAISLDDGS